MTEKKYPEEIYPKLGFRTDDFGRITYRTTFDSDYEYAYDLGYKHGQKTQEDPLTIEATATVTRIVWILPDGSQRVQEGDLTYYNPETGTYE